jgi:hypothetical protein
VLGIISDNFLPSSGNLAIPIVTPPDFFDKAGKGPNLRGDRAVAIVIGQLESEGYIILGEQVEAKSTTLTYERRYDLLARNPRDGIVYGVEVKSTISDGFKLDAKQVAFDVQVMRHSVTTKDGRTIINGVMYRGIDFGTKSAAIWNTHKLVKQLNAEKVPMYLHKPPLEQ